MLFSSPFFIFIFLPLFLGCFFITPKRYRDIVLLVGSLSFYFWGEPSFSLLAISSGVLDFYLCNKIYNTQSPRPYLITGICTNLAILIYFKYTNFFLTAFASIAQLKIQPLNILLPIGVSFIVFEKITYLVDVYRRVGKPAQSLMAYLNYVFLFPKLLAGPIIKYHEIEPQLRERSVNLEKLAQGLQRFFIGLAKKVFIADACGSIANQVFALPNSSLSFGYAWLGILCFTIQIYFDFSGYSDMALGLAKILGFDLRENFNKPYIATSFTDFWRRWHISLSTWIKEYLYIPLGGNRVGPIRIYFNLWLCFLLSGLWHGANWTFLLWGAYNGFFLIVDRLFLLKLSGYLTKPLNIAITMFFVMLGWVIFRSNDFTQMKMYFYALSHISSSTSYIDITADIYFILIVSFILACTPKLDIQPKNSVLSVPLYSMTCSILGLMAICKMIGTSYTPFIYFNF